MSLRLPNQPNTLGCCQSWWCAIIIKNIQHNVRYLRNVLVNVHALGLYASNNVTFVSNVNGFNLFHISFNICYILGYFIIHSIIFNNIFPILFYKYAQIFDSRKALHDPCVDRIHCQCGGSNKFQYIRVTTANLALPTSSQLYMYI